MRCGAAVSLTGHTGHSEAIHSPEACVSMVVKETERVGGSIAVVWRMAIWGPTKTRGPHPIEIRCRDWSLENWLPVQPGCPILLLSILFARTHRKRRWTDHVLQA